MGPGRHFSGSYTEVLVRFLNGRGPEVLEEVLRRAGETRSPRILGDPGSWSTYPQFRALLESSAQVLGGSQHLREAGRHAMDTSIASPGLVQVFHSLGSADAVFANADLISASSVPVVEIWARNEGSDLWVIGQKFKPGFAPFPEYCAFVSGLLPLLPQLFGHTAVEVTEKSCQCWGDDECEFSVRWSAAPESHVRLANVELEVELLSAHLDTMMRAVQDLVSGESLGTLLPQIVASAARVVQAPAYLLALRERVWTAGTTYSEGMSDADAQRIAADMLEGHASKHPGMLAVPVTSKRCDYGSLAVLRAHGTEYVEREGSMLAAFARLAAAALDAAGALDDAHRQAKSARALLSLSESLSEITSAQEMAARVARAIPEVVDCDRVLVLLPDPTGREFRVAAAHGFSRDLDSELRGLQLRHPHETGGTAGNGPLHTNPAGPLRSFLADHGANESAVVPIAVEGDLLGWIAVDVVEGRHRLYGTDAPERLAGLAAQAATSFRNIRLVDEIRHQSLHDALTGLPNRVLVLDRAEQMLARSRREHAPVAAFFIDLDNFKGINDTLGHQVGDQLLVAVAERLSGVLRASDTVGRMGGDEFVVLAEGVSLAAGPELVAERLLGALQEQFALDGHGGHALKVTASVGIASGEHCSASEMLRDADIALYEAKSAGKDQYAVFDPTMQSETIERLELELDLRHALDAQQFFLVYQPLFDLDAVTLTGFEALLRWQHPTRGVISPDVFIPMLEASGAIVDVGRWVLEQACIEAESWRAAGRSLSVSVNVSMRQLESDVILHDVRGALALSQLDPSALLLEVTETALMRDAPATARRLADLKRCGVAIAIDDFGTGYSSLAYLQQFPVDMLKIDRGFISRMNDSAQSRALVHMLLQLGRTLGLRTLAEGIEQPAQLERLREEACDSGQGFLFSKPLDPSDIAEFVDEWSDAQKDDMGERELSCG